jgi:hypothetical protein
MYRRGKQNRSLAVGSRLGHHRAPEAAHDALAPKETYKVTRIIILYENIQRNDWKTKELLSLT